MQKSTSTESRRLLHALSDTLREFRLVDRFRLSELVACGQLPTKREIAQRLKAGTGVLPPSVSAEFLADAILANLTRVAGTKPAAGIVTLKVQLSKIRSGAKDANIYHNTVFLVLRTALAHALTKGRKEEKMHNGRKRVDIVFKNSATTGFFSELRHQLKCPFIYFECKNYSEDLGNPEFDQIAGRFSKRRGEFGVIVCRKLKDKQAALARCKDFANDDRGYIIVFERCRRAGVD